MQNHKILGSIILALGIAGVMMTAQIPETTFTDDPGPRLFPYFSCGILILCGIGMFLIPAKGQTPAPAFLSPEAWRRAGLMTGLLSLYGVALWTVGFAIATVVATFALYQQIAGPGKWSWLRGGVYSAAVYGTVYLLFGVVLNSYLPEGLLH